MKPKIPFGIISIETSWPNNMNYNRLNYSLVIEYEPKLTAAYFWAQQFWFHGGNGGYFGIQSDGDINGTRQKIAIFSIWESTRAFKSSQIGSTSEPFGHEGSGYSCKIPFQWNEGTVYTLELRKIPQFESSWEAVIIDTINIQEYSIGGITVPSEWGNIQPKTNFFVEYFREVASCSDTPYEKSQFNKPTLIEKSETKPISSNCKTYGECSVIGIISKIGTDDYQIETGHKR